MKYEYYDDYEHQAFWVGNMVQSLPRDQDYWAKIVGPCVGWYRSSGFVVGEGGMFGAIPVWVRVRE